MPSFNINKLQHVQNLIARLALNDWSSLPQQIFSNCTTGSIFLWLYKGFQNCKISRYFIFSMISRDFRIFVILRDFKIFKRLKDFKIFPVLKDFRFSMILGFQNIYIFFIHYSHLLQIAKMSCQWSEIKLSICLQMAQNYEECRNVYHFDWFQNFYHSEKIGNQKKNLKCDDDWNFKSWWITQICMGIGDALMNMINQIFH